MVTMKGTGKSTLIITNPHLFNHNFFVGKQACHDIVGHNERVKVCKSDRPGVAIV